MYEKFIYMDKIYIYKRTERKPYIKKGNSQRLYARIIIPSANSGWDELSFIFNFLLVNNLNYFNFSSNYNFYFYTKTNIKDTGYETFTYSSINQFGYYLAGLIEADGSIIIPKEGSTNSPTISIIFNIDDKPLALCIKNRLDFGSIKIDENLIKF